MSYLLERNSPIGRQLRLQHQMKKNL